MSIHLLVALIALGLLHVMPQLAGWRAHGLFRGWVAQLSDTSGVGRVVLALLLPLLICALLMWLFGRSPLGALLQLLLWLAVLIYCLGPRDFEADLEAVVIAPNDVAREAAAQALADDGTAIPWRAAAVGVSVVYAALRRRFGVLFWFFVLGPIGALLYRLSQQLARDETLELDSDASTAATYTANALDWLPAQLLTFTLAVVGHWEAVIGAWKRWHSQAAPTSWYMAGPVFLGVAAQAEVMTDIETDDGDVGERSDPLVELIRLRGALLRALLVWLSVVALIVIGGWAS